MYLIISMFNVDDFIFFLLFQLEMDDGNIFSDKMSPHQKVLTIHLLVDSYFNAHLLTVCVQSCLHLQSPHFYSLEHSLHTFHIFVWTVFGLFLEKDKDKHGWNWYITPLPLTQRQQVSRTHWNLPTKLQISEKHQINAHYQENLKSHTRKKVHLLYWPTWRKSRQTYKIKLSKFTSRTLKHLIF